jgi:carbon storage regulator CsrA
MLVLSRRSHEKILFPCINATIQVVSIKAGVVRLGIEAPPAVKVLREEVHERLAEWDVPEAAAPTQAASAPAGVDLLVRNRLRIARLGLALLQQQLQAGHPEDAEATLAKLDEDLQLLEQRLGGVADVPLPPRSAPVRQPVLM